MRKIEKMIGSFVDFDRDEKSNKIFFILTLIDMFEWATSWGVVIISDYDKPILAYKHFFNYCKKNNFNFDEIYNSVEYPSTKTVEGVERYFKENQKIFNSFIDAIKDYNDFTRNNLENEKFTLKGD
jgi:hypothetical protein